MTRHESRLVLSVLISLQLALQPAILYAGPNDKNGDPNGNATPSAANASPAAPVLPPAFQGDGTSAVTVQVGTPAGQMQPTVVDVAGAGVTVDQSIKLALEMAENAGVPATIVVPGLGEVAAEGGSRESGQGSEATPTAKKKASFDALSRTIAFVNTGYEFIFFIYLQNYFASPSEELGWIPRLAMASAVTTYNVLIEFMNQHDKWDKKFKKGGRIVGHKLWTGYQKSEVLFSRGIRLIKGSVGQGTLEVGEAQAIQPRESAMPPKWDTAANQVGSFVGMVVLFGLVYGVTVLGKYADNFNVGVWQMAREVGSLTQAGVESGGAFFLYKAFLNAREVDGIKSQMPMAFYNTFSQLRYATLGAFMPFMIMAAGTKAPNLVEQSPQLLQMANQAQGAVHQLMPFLPSASLTALRTELVLGGFAMAAAIKAAQRYLPPNIQDYLRTTAFVTLTAAIPLASTALTGRFDLDHPTIAEGAAAFGRLLFSVSSGLGVFLIFFSEDSLQYDPKRAAFLNRIDSKFTPVRSYLERALESIEARLAPVRSFLGEVFDSISAIRQGKVKVRIVANPNAPDLNAFERKVISGIQFCAGSFSQNSSKDK